MRVGMTCYPSYGGSGVVASELGRQLARRGHSVHFITYDVPFRVSTFQENVFFHGVEVPSYPLFKHPPYLLALANKMVEVAKDEKLDILHVHYAIPHATSAFLARQVLAASGGGPAPAVITTLHGTDITLVGSEPSFADLTAYSIEQSDGVTAVSESLRRRTLETFKITRDIKTIYNFVDPRDYGCAEAAGRERPGGRVGASARDEAPTSDASPARDRLAAPGDARSLASALDEKEVCRSCLSGSGEAVVSHISNFRPVKRADWVVRIFAAAAKDLRARLALIGDGPDLHSARMEAQRLGISDRVVYLGKQERVEGLLAASDVFLLPSLEESFGLAALEAMAAGTPVIASRVGGLPEVVGDAAGPIATGAGSGEAPAGFLYDPQDFEGMVGGLRRLLLDHELRARCGAAARDRAFDLFTSDRIVPQYEAYYEEVLAGSRAGNRRAAAGPGRE